MTACNFRQSFSMSITASGSIDDESCDFGRGTWFATLGRDGYEAKADGRDRRTAYSVAYHADFFCAWRLGFRDLSWLQGLHYQRIFSQLSSASQRRDCKHRQWRHRLSPEWRRRLASLSH